MPQRRKSRSLKVGFVGVGGTYPVSIQTMTNTLTADVEATCAQIDRVAALGCDIVRVALDDEKAGAVFPEIVRRSPIPVVADIQFNAQSAIDAIRAGAGGVRLNPGIIRDDETLRPIAELAAERGTAIRVGANAGSLNPGELKKALASGRAKEEIIAELLVDNALRQCAALEKFGVHAIKVALKCSDVPVTLAAYHAFAARTDYPLHIGLTEAGMPGRGLIKSAVAIGSLLLEGIGDTIRVSLTAPPEEEVIAGRRILEACGLRKAMPEVVSCPTCGRTKFDLAGLTDRVEHLVTEIESGGSIINLRKIAVMGCPVNGPGEARDADLGLAGSRNGRVVLFRFGETVGIYDAEEGFELFRAEILKHTSKRITRED